MPKTALRKQEYCHQSHLKSVSDAISREREILETALSAEKPESAAEALIVTACCAYRLDLIKAAISEGGDDQDDTDRRIVEDTLARVIPALEKLAGVTIQELGLESYFSPPPSPSELVADVAKLKERARQEHGELAGFSVAEPVSNPKEYEYLKERLKRIMTAWKTMNDLNAIEDDDPLHIALLAKAEAAEEEIAALPAMSLAVAAAKVVISAMAELRSDLMIRNANGGWSCPQQTAQAALKAIEWFGHQFQAEAGADWWRTSESSRFS